MARANQISARGVIAASIYVVLIAVLVGVVWVALVRVNDGYRALRAAETMLAQLEGRSLRSDKATVTGFANAPTGSPFLEGQTLTVAGAALLQRIAGSVNRIGGNVLSSQVDLQRADAKDGWISLTVSCEIDEANLQPLLYDIESGMPFLFTDQLLVQAPTAGVETSRMRIVLAVSGQWRGSRQ
jgi:general secretion pathway protein M